MVSQAEIIQRVITLWFLVLSQVFRDGMGPFKLIQEYIPGQVSVLLKSDEVLSICSPLSI